MAIWGMRTSPFIPSAKKITTRCAPRRISTETLRLAAYAKSDYDTNSASLTSYASHSRQYGMDGSGFRWIGSPSTRAMPGCTWIPWGDQLLLNTALVTGDESYNVQQHSHRTLAARIHRTQRVDISVCYSHVQDVGDDGLRRWRAARIPFNPRCSRRRHFPLRFLSPQARPVVRITPRSGGTRATSINGYREDFSALQNYGPHRIFVGIVVVLAGWRRQVLRKNGRTLVSKVPPHLAL